MKNQSKLVVKAPLFAVFLFLFILNTFIRAADYIPFEGPKSTWHEGFERFDFEMDDASMEIKPTKQLEGEGFGVKLVAEGKRRCVVVVPKNPAPGFPWSWQGFYWDHEPQTEVELLKRGYHIAYVSGDAGKQWDTWYAYLQDHGLSRKPCFVGMSRGGANAYDWATSNPSRVSCIYADNPAIRPRAFTRLSDLAANDVGLLNICGSLDFLLQRHTLRIEEAYQSFGGRITVMIKEGTAHHPHSLRNPKFIADWITSFPQGDPPKRPDYLSENFAKTYYYDINSTNIFLPEENTYAVCRGPGFVEAYERYDQQTKSRWGVTGMMIIPPKTPAPGKPWMMRASPILREAPTDQLLLAKGFAIVTVPVTKETGPSREEWDETYRFMTNNGYAKKPLVVGVGAAAGEAYGWAIANPEKVACIVARNPVMRSLAAKGSLLDKLEPLAKAGVPLLHVSDHNDPALESNTREVEKRYAALGGNIKVIIHERDGRFPLPRADRQRVLDFIFSHTKQGDISKLENDKNPAKPGAADE